MAVPPIDIPVNLNMAGVAEQLQAVADASEAAFVEGIARDAERAKQKVEELKFAQKALWDTVEQNSKRMEEIAAKRETADAKTRESLDIEYEKLRRLTEQKRIDDTKLEEKIIMQERVIALAAAANDSERMAIDKTTQARIASIRALGDERRAIETVQRATTEGQDEVNTSFATFIRMLGAVTGMYSGLGALKAIYDGIRDSIQNTARAQEDVISGLRTLFELQNSQQKGVGGFNNEFGLVTQQSQQSAYASLSSISANLESTGQGSIGPTDIATAATAMGPTLRSKGITDPNSARFADIVGQGAILQSRGVSGTALRDLGGEFIGDNTTGAQFNQQFGDLFAAAGGSPQNVNQIGEIWSQNAEKFHNAGYTFQDFLKIYVSGQGPMGERTKLLNQAGQGFDRLLGMNAEQKVKFYEQINPALTMGHSERRKFGMEFAKDPMKQLQLLEDTRDGGTPELDGLMKQWMSGDITSKQFIPQLIDATSGMDPERQAEIVRAFAGPRNIISSLSTRGAGGVTLPKGAMLKGDSSQLAIGRTDVSRNEFEQLQTPQTPGAQLFNSYLNIATADLKTVRPMIAELTSRQASPFNPSDSEAQTGMAYGEYLIKLVRMKNDIANGKVNASDTDVKNLDNSISNILSAMGMIVTGQDMFDFANDSEARTQGLKDIDAQGTSKWLANTIDWSALHSNAHQITNGDTASFNFEMGRQAQQAIKSHSMPTTQPTTQPSSMNWHTYNITNYGAGYDNSGVPNPYDNTRLG